MPNVLDMPQWELDARSFPEPAPQPRPFNPARPIPPYPPRNLHNRPTYEVDATDALACDAAAVHVVGDRCACETHYMEVKRAYWVTESRALILHDIDEAAGYHCGDTFKAVAS